ncbi:MAG: zinc-ribbon domain-containing protein [Polyangiaceae bacterium]|jgi:predicted Zn finger-like uncharacterized protein
MDVQCERCKAEYEFDDALVSGRGTTVRCTNCGHQFKVRRAESSAVKDQWIVTNSEGQTVTFTTLRDLQRAILAKQVRRDDLLQRDAMSPRSLASIAELEPFFEGRPSSRPPAAPQDGSQAPAAFPKRMASWETSASGESSPAMSNGQEALPPMREKIDTLRPPLSAAAAPPPPAARAGDEPNVLSFSTNPPSLSQPAPVLEPTELGGPSQESEGRASLPPPTRPVRRSSFEEDLDEFAFPPPAYEEAYSTQRRRRVGGWVVALALLVAVGVVGWAVAKPYLVGREAGATAQVDPRVQSFLLQGEGAMAEGNLDAAQENFDKASVLAEKDVRVLLDEARVTAAKADVPWLKLRLLPPNAADDLRTSRAQLEDLGSHDRAAADQAFAAAPDEPAASRVKVDALRLVGDLDGARAHVAKIVNQAEQPETAYVLAALDLAEPTPVWATVTERLRLSAAAEGNGGRARAALVYALARSGDLVGAREELAKLDALSRPYPLLASLHAYVERASVPVEANRPPAISHLVSAKSPAGPSAPQLGAASPTAALATPGEDTGSTDPRIGMQLASAAIKRGEFSRARRIYQGIVDRNPSDSEAMAGLGDVARLQGDPGGAMVDYKRAITVNPSYLPALLGLADTEWVGGDRTASAKTYSDILDRFPEGTYPPYVAKRVSQVIASQAAASTEQAGLDGSSADPPSSDFERTK